MLIFLDSRATNISIGLTPFRSRGVMVEHIVDAIVTLDTHFLDVESLYRLRDILPNDNEVKALQVASITTKL